jgi:methylated-DNA-[protein]-cysteine S-methyltransferase
MRKGAHTKQPAAYAYKIIQSPIGELKLVASERGLAAILWKRERAGRVPIASGNRNDTMPILLEAEKQLAEYFAGTRKKFDLRLDFTGTDFQKKVWKALLDIPFGQTVSYADVARKIGSPKAVRAVGAANGRNPISIIAACHRVIGSSGTLTGYAGGMKAKAALLAHEGLVLEGAAHRNAKVMIASA